MKKLGILSILLIVCISFTGCTAALALLTAGILTMGTDHYDSVDDYGVWKENGIEIGFLPESVDEYTVNGFSYIIYNYFDVCYEVFLDITVTEEQMGALIEEARSYSDSYCEQDAWYAEGYVEIVFEDEYNRGEPGEEQEDGLEQVGWATVDKVIYNEETLNIIFVSLHAHDSDVHDVENVEYFNRFAITPEEYVKHLPERDNNEENNG